MAGYLIVAGLSFVAGLAAGVLGVKIGWINVANVNKKSIT